MAKDTAHDVDPFAALDAVAFVEKRDKRADYTGDIPPRIQSIVEETLKSGKIASLPLNAEQYEMMAPMFAAAASRMGKTARLWQAKGETGYKLTVGERRGRKPQQETPAETDAATDVAPE